MTDRLGRLAALRVPSHVAVLVGVSTAAYAVTLAGVTVNQASGEAALAAERAPAIAGIQDIAERNARLTADLEAAGTNYDRVSQAYLAAGGRLSDLEAALAALATSVGTIDGVSKAMPATVSLPRVSRPRTSGGAPATSATTGASGAP
ncbi:MAG TPA: hypothetical protein VNH13_09295 [Candidatus Acidoferrales bacterium]|nr:hypothetical protein [Candidatus Acidoferrales bacterium]